MSLKRIDTYMYKKINFLVIIKIVLIKKNIYILQNILGFLFKFYMKEILSGIQNYSLFLNSLHIGMQSYLHY